MSDTQKNANIREIFEALGNKVRMNIFLNIQKAEEAGVQINIKEATYPYELKRATISHHIKLLLDSSIIQKNKIGKNVFLKINRQKLLEIEEFSNQFK